MQNFTNPVVTLTLALFIQAEAHSIEPAAQVKVSTLLKTETSWDGKPLVYPTGKAEVTGLIMELAPGAETGWHSHAVPSFDLLLDGELEIQLKDGATKRMLPGEALAEVVNTAHNGRNVGSVPVRILVFYAGAVGQQCSVKEKTP